MKFALTTEQADLQQMLGGYLAERAPLAATVQAVGSQVPLDRDAWTSMAGDLGLQGVDVPEALGGVGLGAVELSLVLQQAGRVLYPGPLLASTGLGLSLLLAATGEEAVDALVAEVAAGRIVTAAVADDGGAWRAGEVATTAAEPGGWRLNGTKLRVMQAEQADELLVAARLDDGTLALFSVSPTDARVTVDDSIDPTRSSCTVQFSDTPARHLAMVSDGVLDAAGLRATFSVSSESLGAAGRILEIASTHATNRRQFDRPVGAFQGVKHRLADVLVEVELATSAVFLAACHLGDGDLAAARVSVPMARLAADTALARASAASVQVHGGIGFTWENESHVFVKRARANRELLGGPSGRLAEVWEHAPEFLRSA